MINRRSQFQSNSIAHGTRSLRDWKDLITKRRGSNSSWSHWIHHYAFTIILAGLAVLGFVVFFVGNPGGAIKTVNWIDTLPEFIAGAVLAVWVGIVRRINTRSVNFLRFFLGCSFLLWFTGLRFYLHWVTTHHEFFVFLQLLLALSGLTLMTLGMARWVEEFHLLIQQLESNVTRYQMLSETDQLTGLSGRHQFELTLKQLLDSHQSFSLILLDLDHLGSINQQYGDSMGDTVIEHTARLIRRQVREFDYAFRVDGEEFALLLVNCPQHRIEQSAKQILDAISNNAFFTDDDESFSITASIGISQCRSSDTPAELYRRADTAVTQAKQQGRNRIISTPVFRDEG